LPFRQRGRARAAPQPPKTSQKVPKLSAMARFISFTVFVPCEFESCRRAGRTGRVISCPGAPSAMGAATAAADWAEDPNSARSGLALRSSNRRLGVAGYGHANFLVVPRESPGDCTLPITARPNASRRTRGRVGRVGRGINPGRDIGGES